MKRLCFSFLYAFVSLGVSLVGPAVQAQSPLAVTQCDLLAGHPADPDSLTPGRSREQMGFAEAVEVCRAAVAENPDDPRQHYQLARVLYYDDKEFDTALRHLRIAAEHGYRQAIFVLGYLHAVDERLGPDFCRAGQLWQRAAALGHPWSHYHLVEKTLDDGFHGCGIEFSPKELLALVQAATGLISASSSAGRVEALYRRYLLYVKAPGLVEPTPPTQCDALAAHGFDGGRAAPGLSSGEMKSHLAASIAACREAVASAPGNPRLLYQLARGLYYAGQVAEAMPILEASSELGWPQGTFVLGYVYSGDDQVFPAQPCRAAGLYRASLDHDHFWSKVFLAEQWLTGALAGCTISLDELDVRQMLRSAEVQAQIDPSYAEGVAQVGALLERLGGR